MIIDPDFPDHWKTRFLIDLLDGDEAAPMYLIRMWAHCQNRRSHTFSDICPAAVKAICRYCGEPEEIVSALEQTGFIVLSDGVLTVCGWDEYNSSLIANWENGKKGGRQRNPKRTQTEPKRNPTGTQTEPSLNPSRTDREEKSREEKSRGEGSPPSLPEKLNCHEFIHAFTEWKAYRGKAYKPKGEKAFLTLAAKRAEEHGLPAVIAALQRAMASGYQGWDFESSWNTRGSPPANGDPRGNLALRDKLLAEMDSA